MPIRTRILAAGIKYAERHDRTLATSVEAALEITQGKLLHQRSLSGPLQSALRTVPLQYAVESRPDCLYSVHVIRFGRKLTLIALGSEVVVDYALRLKSELSRPDGPAIWVAGYSNDYSGYIPSRRVLLEGGYEATRANRDWINLPQPNAWDPSIEEQIIGKVHEMMKAPTEQD